MIVGVHYSTGKGHVRVKGMISECGGKEWNVPDNGLIIRIKEKKRKELKGD